MRVNTLCVCVHEATLQRRPVCLHNNHRAFKDFFPFSFSFMFLRCILSVWSQWPRVLTRGSAAERLLGFRVRILPRSWMPVCCVFYCQVEVSAWGWSLVQRNPTECDVCNREASIMRRLSRIKACCGIGEKNSFGINKRRKLVTSMRRITWIKLTFKRLQI
jgi:hypothetical protein